MKKDLEDFKRCMRTGYRWSLLTRDEISKSDLEKSLTKLLDDQKTSIMSFKRDVNNTLIIMKQNDRNFFKNMERKLDKWEKSLNLSSEQTDGTEPPLLPQAQTEQVNAVFTEYGKSDDYPKIQKDPPHPIIVNNKIKKDKTIKINGYHVVKTNEYPFREYIPKIPYPGRLKVDHSQLNRIVKES